MKQLLTLVLAFAISTIATAQNGTIQGTVYDGSAETTETLIGAAVVLAGTTKGMPTDIDGKYTISVAPGTYQLVASYIGFDADTIEVKVAAGQTVTQDFTLGSGKLMDEFVVEATLAKRGDAHMDKMRTKSGTVMDGMSGAAISRTGDNNVAAAVSRGVGVSVEGGKYVYVRGLSDRYSKTTLNGAEIPGLDPNRNAVQMDLFPTNLVDNLSIVKTFSPDLPGSFTGGLVNITTKDFPDSFSVMFSTSLSFNPQSNFRSDFLQPTSGGLDFLGFDDGTRAKPLMMQNRVVPSRFENARANERISVYSRSFNKDFGPQTTNSGLDQTYAFSIGNYKTVKENNRLGYVVGLTYNTSYDRYSNGTIGRYSITGTESETAGLNPEIVLNDERGNQSVIWGALANVGYETDKHKFSFNMMRNQNGINDARYQEGNFFRDAQDLYIQTRTLQYLQRSLTSAQMRGEHQLDSIAGNGMKIDWLGSYVLSEQTEPDLRFFTNDYTIDTNAEQDTIYSIQEALYTAPARYYRDMNETNIDGKVNFELPIESRNREGMIKFGISNVYKKRYFNETRYNFRSQGVQYHGSITDYLADENMNVGVGNYIYLEGNEGEDRRNSYVGTDNVAAAYAMTDLYILDSVRLITGARFEQTNIELYSLDATLDRGILKNNDILPAINLVWEANKKTNWRAAYTRTLARPNFRELAPFANFDFVGGFTTIGNPNLQRTLIDNFDLRYEFRPNYNEILSASVFGKIFQNPIERAFNPQAANDEMTFLNVDRGLVYGIELEARKRLNFIHENWNNWTIGGNVTLVKSQVNIEESELAAIRVVIPDHPETRQMFGQSPYIVNTFLNYQNDSIGLAANLNYNISGDKLAVVGTKGMPNVLERSRGRLDFNISKQLGQKFTLKVGARNLLNPEYLFTQTFKDTDYVFRSYKIGRSYSIGLKYNL